MPPVDDQINELKSKQADAGKKLKDLGDEISATSKTLGEKQAALSLLSITQTELTKEIEALERLKMDNAALSETLATGRQGAEAELHTAQAEVAEIETHLAKELSQERCDFLKAALSDTDLQIAEGARAAREASREATHAEGEAAKAQEDANKAAKKYEDSLAELQALPKGLEAARTKLSKLRAAVKAARDSGRAAEAFVTLLDLKVALAELSAQLEKKPDEISARLPDELKASTEQAAAAKLAALNRDQKRAAAATAQNTATARSQVREAEIKKALTGPSEAKNAPAGGGTGIPPAEGHEHQGDEELEE